MTTSGTCPVHHQSYPCPVCNPVSQVPSQYPMPPILAPDTAAIVGALNNLADAIRSLRTPESEEG